MKIEIIALGKTPPNWINIGFQEYSKRLKPWILNLTEISPKKNINNSKLMLTAINPKSLVIALDEHGQLWNTQQLAKNLQTWQENYSKISLLIGGPDGLVPECLQRANVIWSLSPLTFPHHLVRILVAEQIYRAWTILNSHPYHRGN